MATSYPMIDFILKTNDHINLMITYITEQGMVSAIDHTIMAKYKGIMDKIKSICAEGMTQDQITEIVFAACNDIKDVDSYLKTFIGPLDVVESDEEGEEVITGQSEWPANANEQSGETEDDTDSDDDNIF